MFVECLVHDGWPAYPDLPQFLSASKRLQLLVYELAIPPLPVPVAEPRYELEVIYAFSLADGLQTSAKIIRDGLPLSGERHKEYKLEGGAELCHLLLVRDEPEVLSDQVCHQVHEDQAPRPRGERDVHALFLNAESLAHRSLHLKKSAFEITLVELGRKTPLQLVVLCRERECRVYITLIID